MAAQRVPVAARGPLLHRGAAPLLLVLVAMQRCVPRYCPTELWHRNNPQLPQAFYPVEQRAILPGTRLQARVACCSRVKDSTRLCGAPRVG